MEIGSMIDKEISALVPDWSQQDNQAHSFSFQDDDENDDDHNLNRLDHPFYSFSSCSSSQSSLSGLISLCRAHTSKGDYRGPGSDLLQDGMFQDNESSSHNSGKYSNMHYNSCNEHDFDQSPRARDHHQQISSATHQYDNCTRFCSQEHPLVNHHAKEHKQVNDLLRSKGALSHTIDHHNPRIRDAQFNWLNSLVVLRSQLLHWSLAEEMNRLRLFKTVGAVENIGYVAPYDVSSKPRPSTNTGGSSSKSTRDHRW